MLDTVQARRGDGQGWKDRLGRIGLTGRGALYGVIAVLALQLAVGSPEGDASPEGAIEWIAGQPFGKFLLVLMTGALFSLAAWRILGQGDRVGGMVLSDTGAAAIPARRARSAATRLLDLVADRSLALSAEAPVVPDAAARLNETLRRAAGIVTHDWLLLVVSDFDGADDDTLRILTGIARGNDIILALVHDPSAHETPTTGRMVVGDGTLQVELDFAAPRVRQNLAAVGGDRLKRLLAWQEHLDAAILPISAGEPTIPQILHLFGAPPRRR